MHKSVCARIHQSLRSEGELALRSMDGGFSGSIGRDLLAAGFCEGDAVKIEDSSGAPVMGADGELLISSGRLYCASGVRRPLSRAGLKPGDVVTIIPI